MSKLVSTRKGFGDGLLKLARQRKDVVAFAADTYRSFKMGPFVDEFPDRYFEFGIAEQNMMMSAAGMASSGKVVFVAVYSPFVSMRALEQLRTFIAYPNLNVKIAAGLGGLTGDTGGVTHQGTEDLGIIRAIPNITLVCPADAIAAEKYVEIAAEVEGPVYMRIGRGATPLVYNETQEFKLGKAIRVRDYGSNVTVIAIGPCLIEAIRAADRLKETGVNIRVLDMHTLKPLDRNSILEAARETGKIITIEDGTINGGLGSAVSEVLAEEGILYKGKPVRFKRLGLENFGSSGTLDELLKFYGLNADNLIKTVNDLL